jgi:serine/threonine-protein kinase
MDVTMSMARVIGGRYRVGDLLGRGGMGSVWRGHDLRLDRAVAIKELAGPWLSDPTAAQRFDREARTAARLLHPNIVSVYDVGVHEQTPYIVMELIEGATVAQLLATGPMPVDTVVAIAAQTCDGLVAAHRAGVVHRDVKPANLMLTGTGVLKICDFGIAQALAGAIDKEAVGGEVLGSSRYMAPEQFHDGHVDARADLYGLGCTMYAMLTGAPPFQGNVGEVVRQQLHEAPVPLREHRADVPAPLESLAMSLLAKDPEDRPSGAAEVRARLLDLAESPAPAVVPLVLQRNSGIGDARHWPFALAALAVLVATILSVIASVHLASKPPAVATAGPATPTAITVSPMMTATGSPQAPDTATPWRPAQVVQAPPALTPPTGQTPPADPIAVLRLAIQQQVDTGNLRPDRAPDLNNTVDAIAHSAYTGNTADVARNIKELQGKFAALRTGGQLSAGGYDTLMSDLDAVSAKLA